MNGRGLVVGLLGAMVVAIGGVFWLGMSGGGRSASGPSLTPPAEATSRAVPESSAASARGGADGRRASGSVADRRARDELRRRIYAGWAEGDGEVAVAAKRGRLPPMPTSPDGGIDPKYIQSVIREDMMPMAAKCYEDLLARRPDAGGRVEMAFKIVGDDTLGGIIEEAEIDGGVAGALGDPALETCLRESLLSLSFQPPPQDGWVTVVYPLEFGP